MLSAISRLKEVLHDTLLTKAQGEMLDRLTDLYGFRRPAVIRQAEWRNAVLSSVFSARGTPGPMFRFLENVFGQWVQECSTFTCTALSSNLLEVPESVEGNTQLENRFCRIGDNLYRSSVLDDRELTFHAIDCALFKRADFETGDSYTVKFLPFDIVERDGEFKVLLDDGILNVPPSYLKQDASVVRASGEPFGGQILDFFSEVEAQRYGDQEQGPFPAYLAVDDFTEALGGAFLQMLVAGVRGQILDFKHSLSDTSLYGSYRQMAESGTAQTPVIVNPTRG